MASSYGGGGSMGPPMGAQPTPAAVVPATKVEVSVSCRYIEASNFTFFFDESPFRLSLAFRKRFWLIGKFLVDPHVIACGNRFSCAFRRPHRYYIYSFYLFNQSINQTGYLYCACEILLPSALHRSQINEERKMSVLEKPAQMAWKDVCCRGEIGRWTPKKAVLRKKTFHWQDIKTQEKGCYLKYILNIFSFIISALSPFIGCWS